MTTLTSAGHVLSDERWLDAHAEACAPEYEAFVREAGFRPGWRVLDLGSGSGSFEGWLSEAVGSDGAVVCVDIAAENCSLSRRKLPPETGASVQAGFDAMPFQASTFDGVWCANALQYLTGAAVANVLADLRRVVRPGGIVAIKDVDMTAFKVSPASPFLASHLAEACLLAPDAPPESAGSLRGRELKRLLEQAGFVDVRQHAAFIERWAPLTPAEAELWSGWLAFLAGLAQKRGVPETDRSEWLEIARDGGRAFVSRPDFYGCEAQVLAVGRVPS